jgi:hypothetical protein
LNPQNLKLTFREPEAISARKTKANDRHLKLLKLFSSNQKDINIPAQTAGADLIRHPGHTGHKNLRAILPKQLEVLEVGLFSPKILRISAVFTPQATKTPTLKPQAAA